MSQMTISVHVGGFLQTNGYIVSVGDACFAVDAPQGMAEFVSQSELQPTHLLLTHQHFDHSTEALTIEKLGLKIVSQRPHDPSLILEERGLPLGLTVPAYTVDTEITSGPLECRGLTLDVRHVPGHSPDSIVFYSPEHSVVFGGDALFRGSIGRPDLPGGDEKTLITAIKSQLMTLPDDVTVFPGHGPETQIGIERQMNPHLR